MSILGHKNLSNWNDYAFDCPEGQWTGRLEQLAWGKSTNLILCFADVQTGKQYRLSVFSGTRYKPRDGSHDFKNDAAPGDLFELTTKKTKNGNPDLKSARKIIAAPTTSKPMQAPLEAVETMTGDDDAAAPATEYLTKEIPTIN